MLAEPATTITSRELQEQMVALVRAFGLHRSDQTPCGQPISVTEAYTLMELSHAEPLSQNELAARLRLEKSTVSRLVGILEGREWITRTRSSSDGRAVELRLSDAGRRAAEKIAETRQAKFARVLAAIPEEQRGSVIDALRILVEAMDESQ
jgi:DNA-binding MarR family transcriptional regulator